MKKYKCKICGHIYDDAKEEILFEELPDDWKCPLCGVPKSMFEEISTEVEENPKEPENRVFVDPENPSIARIEEKCIHCGQCLKTCWEQTGLNKNASAKQCVNCGNCVLKCPVGALIPKYDYKKVLNYLKDTDYTLIVSTSPAVRVAIGDEFGFSPGEFVEGKMVAALKTLGFHYVLDTTFGADLTIMEEATELVRRLKDKSKLPMFTSCCPAWVKYAETFHPELIASISSVKSPISMQAAVIKTYFTSMHNLEQSKIINVALTPCTAKKYEIKRPELGGMDFVITTSELAMMVRECNINFNDLKDEKYDDLLGKGSGAGVIFGNSGGVMEAALRTAYFLLTNSPAPKEFYELTPMRGLEGIKEATLQIDSQSLKIAVVHGIRNLEKLLEKKEQYDFVEVMNCSGGCIGGGGQPLVVNNKLELYEEARMKSLYQNDASLPIRNSYENPQIINLYKSYLEFPGSQKSKDLLHTCYENKSTSIKEKQPS